MLANHQINPHAADDAALPPQSPPADTIVIHCQGLDKQAGDRPILCHVHFSVRKGEVLGIIGPSGAGKSTLLRCINQLETWDQGQITVLGHTLNPGHTPHPTLQRHRIGMVFQQFNLWPHFSVMDNLIYAPCRVLQIPAEEARNRAKSLLNRVGLLGKAYAYPHQLSGGQQQRVAIVRAMMMQPEILLFDEPTSALDPHMSQEVLALIRELSHTGITLLIASHELRFIRETSDHLLFMHNGHIVHDGTTKEAFENPPSTLLRDFIHH